MRNRLASRALALWLSAACAAAAQSGPSDEPLTAIDWLRDRTPVAMTKPAPKKTPAEPPVTTDARVPEVTSAPLGAAPRGAVGLLPRSVTGFPADLWRMSDPAALARRIEAVSVEGSPAMQALLYTLLLAEVDVPATDPGDRLLVARLAKLTALGAVEPAEALLDRAGHDTPELFALWADLALIAGDTDRMCAEALAQPALAPAYPLRIYCLAQNGEWPVAATTLESAQSLGAVTPGEAALLLRFLDSEAGEDLTTAPPPEPGPLEYRLLEAIGEAPPTTALPRAFAVIDLTGHGGWKAELEAVERLARQGAISPNRVLGAFTARLPAASGGIWDRVEAWQRFDTALTAGDPPAVARALARAWPLLREARMGEVFAEAYGERLLGLPLSGDDARLAREVALLSDGYEKAATAFGPGAEAFERFLVALAQGHPQDARALDDEQRAIAQGFSRSEAPAAIARLAAEARLGEAILAAIALWQDAVEGDLAAVSDALAAFRALGLEDTARRAALQLLLLRSDA